MFGWWCILFTLGAAALVDSYLDFGGLFRQVNAAFVLLSLLGLLVRITRKTREQSKEHMAERIQMLESELLESKSAMSVTKEPSPTRAHRAVEA